MPGAMPRRLGATLLLALCIGCATPHCDDDLVRATPANEAFAVLMEIIYCLGLWLGPKT